MIEVQIDELVLDDGLGLDAESIKAAAADALADASSQRTEATGPLDAARVGRELAATIRREVGQ